MKVKKILKIILLIIIFISPYRRVNGLILDKNEIKVLPDEEKEIKLSVDLKDNKVSSVSFNLIYNSFDLPGEFIVNEKYSDRVSNTKHTITFYEDKSGVVELGVIKVKAKNDNTNSSKISLSNAIAIKSDGSEYNLYNQELVVSIGEEEEIIIDKNLLKSIDSDIVDIELEKDVFDYNIKIKDTVEELDLKPIANDEEYKIDISTQIIKDIKDNKIEILVKDKENDVEQLYTINIEIEKTKVDNKIKEDIIIFDDSYKIKYYILSGLFFITLIIGFVMINKNKQRV